MTKGASRWLENQHAVQYLLPFLDEQSIISLSALNKAALSAVQTSGYAQLQLLAYLHHDPEYAKRQDDDYWTCIHRIAELERNIENLTPRHIRVFKTPSSLDFYDFGHGSLAFNDLEYPETHGVIKLKNMTSGGSYEERDAWSSDLTRLDMSEIYILGGSGVVAGIKYPSHRGEPIRRRVRLSFYQPKTSISPHPNPTNIGQLVEYREYHPDAAIQQLNIKLRGRWGGQAELEFIGSNLVALGISEQYRPHVDEAPSSKVLLIDWKRGLLLGTLMQKHYLSPLRSCLLDSDLMVLYPGHSVKYNPVQLYRLTGESHILETDKVLDLRTLVAKHLFGEVVEPTSGVFKGKVNRLVTTKGEAPNQITSGTLASSGPTHLGSGFRGATLSPSSGLRGGRMFFGPFVDNGEMELRCEDVNERRANWKAGPVDRRLGALLPVSIESPTPTVLQFRTEYLGVTGDKHHKCPIEPWAPQKGWKLRCDIFARDAAVSRLCFDGRSMMIQCDAETDGGSDLIILDF